MKFKYLLLLLFSGICCLQVYGQWDPQISQYWRIKNYYNPAFAGETEELQVTGLYRHQWVGIENAPRTFIATGDMPFKFLDRVHGVGATVMTESIGLFKNTSMGAQYVYKKNWKKYPKNYLNVGIQLGMMNIGFDADGIRVPDDGKDDNAIPAGNSQSSSFDAALGVTWITPKYYVGISATHLLEPEIDFGENSSSYVVRTYYFTGGGNIPFRNPLYELQPSFLIKSDAVVIQYDVTARLIYNNMFSGGLSWRKGDGFVFLLGFKYKSIEAGYAYDLSTSAISVASSGTHEIFVRYSMPVKLDKGEKNSHKSIRIL